MRNPWGGARGEIGQNTPAERRMALKIEFGHGPYLGGTPWGMPLPDPVIEYEIAHCRDYPIRTRGGGPPRVLDVDAYDRPTAIGSGRGGIARSILEFLDRIRERAS